MKLASIGVFSAFALGGAIASPLAAHDLPVDVLNAPIPAKKEQRTKLQTALAADPANRDLRFQLGAVLCDLGASDDEAASDAALALFKKLYEENPNDAEIRAFYGNACAIHAQYVFFLFATDWADRGFVHMDAAVKAAPDSVSVRTIRALNSAQVPDFLGRDKIAREDFAWLLKRQETNPKDFSPSLLRTISYYAGKLAFKHAEADSVKLLKQAAAIPAAENDLLRPKIQTALEKALAKYPEKPAPAH